MKFSGYIGHDSRNNLINIGVICLTPCIQVTRNTLENFRDLAVNSLNPGSIFLCSGSIDVIEILEKRVNEFS